MALFVTLFILLLLIFAGMTFLLYNLLSKNITSAKAHLDQMGQDYTKKQQEINKKLQEADQYYQTTITKAREEAIELKERLEKEASTGKGKALDEARKESEKIIDRANKTREMLIAEIDQKVEEKALDRACELVEQVLPEHLAQQMHLHWVEELITGGLEELGNLHLPENISQAQLKCAFELSAKQKEQLSQKLKEKLGRDIKLVEESDSSIVAGIVISLGNLVLDGSLKNKIKEAARVQQAASKK